MPILDLSRLGHHLKSDKYDVMKVLRRLRDSLPTTEACVIDARYVPMMKSSQECLMTFRYSLLHEKSLAALLMMGDEVDLSCCGISSTLLALLNISSERAMSLTTLRLRYNNFLMWTPPLDDPIKIHPWASFARNLIGEVQSLKKVDVSHCHRSDDELRHLLEGLLTALRTRSQANHPPLQEIIIEGLHLSSAAIAEAFLTDMKLFFPETAVHGTGAHISL